MNQKKGSIAITVICMLLAFGLTWQLRSVTASGGLTSSTAKARADQLQVQLMTEQNKNEALYKQILEYKDELNSYATSAQESGGYAKVLAQQLASAQLLAGITTVQGSGVVVQLRDSRAANTSGLDENNYVIHDEDLLKVVNELRDAGAEALSLNGERILATSEIRCAGSIVSVNNNRYAAPYTICAIGNTDDLYNALTMRQGVVDSLAIWGIECNISKEDKLTIDAYNGAVEFKYAKAIEATPSAAEGGTE